MPFPDDYLHPSETLILNLRPHWFQMVPSSVALLAALAFGGFAITLENDAVSILSGLLILVSLGWFAANLTSWISSHFVLTSDRLIHREGIIRRSGIEIPLERINTVFSSQNLFERMIGAGDLVVESASTEGRQEFENMRKPSSIQNDIYVAMEANENRKFDRIAGGVQAAPAGPSIPEQIDQLDALRQRGVISEEEFTRKKAELLDRM